MKIDINHIHGKLIEKLEFNGWYKAVRMFMHSDIDKLLKCLRDEVSEGYRFTPPLKNIFSAFENTPYEKTNVVIIGQDPYPQLNTADGIAFSCSIKGKPEKSLQFIFKALYGSYEDQDPDLKRWCTQGVLPLNTAFTTRVNDIGAHYNLWKPFTQELLDHMNKEMDCIFILMGKKAEEWENLLQDSKIFKVSHPASAAYQGGNWDHKNVFNDVNSELKKRGKSDVIW